MRMDAPNHRQVLRLPLAGCCGYDGDAPNNTSMNNGGGKPAVFSFSDIPFVLLCTTPPPPPPPTTTTASCDASKEHSNDVYQEQQSQSQSQLLKNPTNNNQCVWILVRIVGPLMVDSFSSSPAGDCGHSGLRCLDLFYRDTVTIKGPGVSPQGLMRMMTNNDKNKNSIVNNGVGIVGPVVYRAAQLSAAAEAMRRNNIAIGDQEEDDDDSKPFRCLRVSLDPLNCNKSVSNHNMDTILATLAFAPAPAVSLSLWYSSSSISSSSSSTVGYDPIQRSRTPSTLLQSCLKRQLVGCPLIVAEGVAKDSNSAAAAAATTTIQFAFESQIWTFSVSSLNVGRSNGQYHGKDHFVVALILPSTRITLYPKPPSSTNSTAAIRSGSNRSSKEQADATSMRILSPTARHLIDTIACIRHVHDNNNNTGRFPVAAQLATVPSCHTDHFVVGDIPRAFLLSGPPGVGKTHSVRLAVEHAGALCHLVVLQGSELLGQANSAAEAALSLERYFIHAVSTAHRLGDDCVPVIFLDECDALLASSSPPVEGPPAVSLLEAAFSRLLDRMNTDPAWKILMVIAATNRVDALPSGLRRPGRFDREIPMAPPDAALRLEILDAMWKGYNNHEMVPTNADRSELRDIADATVGFVAADLASLVRKAKLFSILSIGKTDKATRPIDFLRRAMSEVGASALRDAALKAPPTTSWDDVAGDPGGAKTALRQAIEWPRTKSKAYERLGLTPPRGILLHGPPGCAKTTLARAAAGASGVAFLSLSPADVFSSSFVGDAEAVVRRAFTLARSAAPCVLFFDEIDAILGSDESSGGSHVGMGRVSSGAETRVLSTFLNEMDGVDGSWKDGVLVLGATNRPWTLDAALLRPGRFDKIIYVPPPDFEGRRSILSMQCKHWSCTIDIDRLAGDSVTRNMTGAEIVGACREAAMRCFRDAAPSGIYDPIKPFNRNNAITFKEEFLVTALTEVIPLLSNTKLKNEYKSFEENRQRNSGG